MLTSGSSAIGSMRSGSYSRRSFTDSSYIQSEKLTCDSSCSNCSARGVRSCSSWNARAFASALTSCSRKDSDWSISCGVTARGDDVGDDALHEHRADMVEAGILVDDPARRARNVGMVEAAAHMDAMARLQEQARQAADAERMPPVADARVDQVRPMAYQR